METSLIFLPMMAIFFGVMDVSLAVFIQSTLTSAARSGTRFAITYGSSYDGNSCASSQATCITQVVQDNAFGFLSGSKSSYITVNYYTANDLTNPADQCNGGTCTLNPNGQSTASLPQTLTNGIVVTYPNQSGNIVEVVVSGYPWNWLVPLPKFYPGTSISLGGESMDVLGALAVGVTVPPNP